MVWNAGLKKLPTLLALPLLAASVSAAADSQVLTNSPSSVDISKGSTAEFSIAVSYDTDPTGTQTTGIGVKVFYDSTKLTFVSMANNHPASPIGITASPSDIQDDTSNSDSDAATDKVANVAWAAFSGDFAAPSDLFTMTFAPATSSYEGTTAINLGDFSPASGYTVTSQNITVTFIGDTVLPEITAPSDITVEATSASGALATADSIVTFLGGATASDNLDGDISASVTTDAPDTFPVGATTVTFTIADSSNNTATATATVTVADTTGPVVVAPADITVGAVDANGTLATNETIAAFLNSATAADAVNGSVAVTNNAPDTFPIGETTVLFSSSDSANNAGSASAKVTIADLTKPIITATDVTLEATSASGVAPTDTELLANASASDNVDSSVTVSTTSSGATFALGATTVTVTAADAAGNAADSATFTVSVVDTTGPAFSGANLSISIEPDEVVAGSDSRITTWLSGVTASDLVDGSVTVSNDFAADSLGESTTAVTFTAVDAAGNSATETYSLIIAAGPRITVPDALSYVSADSSSLAADAPIIVAFLEGASATDSEGATLAVSNDAPAVFEIGTTTVAFTATDSESRTRSVTSTVTILAPSEDNDTDADGMDDAFEVDKSLDPNDASDASGDADGDGLSNIAEYAAGTDPNVDSVAPVVTAPAAISVVAEGPLTEVTLGAPTAEDALDGSVTATADNSGPYAVGSYTVTWSAADAAGNTGTAEQQVVVMPYVETVSQGRTAEGKTFTLDLILNGAPAAYPVEIPFTLSGTATSGEDYSVAGSSVSIASGLVGQLDITVTSDSVAEGEETIFVTLGTPASNAGLGPNKEAQITIVEAAVPPALKMAVAQGGKAGRFIAADAGLVSVTLAITDPNGTHTVDWSQTDNNLVLDASATDLVYVFDPSALAAGSYAVIAAVQDDGIASTTYTTSVLLNLVATDAKTDSDGDGVPDAKDTYTESNIVAVDADSDTAPAVADAGLTLVVGDAAVSGGKNGLQIDEATIAAGGEQGTGEPTDGDDTEYQYPSGVYDFEVQDLPVPGQSVNVVLPVTGGIPALAIYRKYESSQGWFTFVEDSNNYVSSAAGSASACPSSASDSYTKGLTEGHFCIQLTIADGGPNDADGVANGIVDDPGGIAVDDNAPTVTAPEDVSVEADTASGVALTNETIVAFLQGASATDGSDGDVTANITTDAPSDFFALGDTTVTFSVSDAAGNEGTATAVVTITDTVAPVITAPASTTVTATSGSGIAATDSALSAFLNGASATDAVDEDVTITSDAPSTIAVGTTTVTFTATDDAGNISTATATVTVNKKKDSGGGCAAGTGTTDPMLPLIVILSLLGLYRRKITAKITQLRG